MRSPADFIGQRVGRYTIIRHLASGGMAELFIAKQEAVGGFEKELVVKMLQDRYARNPRVVQMFLDEARLAAKLNHQNIVHVYDVDEADGLRYIAMEYIHGETVTDVVRRSIALGGFLPVEHAVQIVADTAAGLAYAHDRRDAEGRLVRIVHRDVSPSNILVTYEGVTKIVDFGIARIQDQIREESGMRPGKVSYMAPEQVRGEGADHRSDIFSLGIVLYEITVGKRLWRGPAEQVMRRIVEEQVPPPTYVRRSYPPALELIVMRALEKRPADRQQSASELHNELLEFLEESGLKSGPRRLAHYMKDLFAPDLGLAPESVERSRQFSEPTGSSIGTPMRDDSEELDFDRRAPLMMRVEAADEDPPAPGLTGLPRGLVPGLTPPPTSLPAGFQASAGSSAMSAASATSLRGRAAGVNELRQRKPTPPPLPADAAPVEARLSRVGSGPIGADATITANSGVGAPHIIVPARIADGGFTPMPDGFDDPESAGFFERLVRRWRGPK